eukprot:SAG22_NODE_279_length_13134_cov_7.532561_1_plen_940_part_00
MGRGEGKGGANVVAVLGFGDENRVAERESYGEKMGNAACGVCAGPLVLVAGLVLIGWNEYRTVQTMKIIEMGEEEYQEASCSTLDSSMNGQLVHVACDIATGAGAPLTSRIESVGPRQNIPAGQQQIWASTAGLKLEPKVEYLSWDEDKHSCTTSKDNRGSTTTSCSYTYSMKWSSQVGTTWQNPAPTALMHCHQQANRCIKAKMDNPGSFPSSCSVGSCPELSHLQHFPGRLPIESEYATTAKFGTAYPIGRDFIDELATQSTAKPTGSTCSPVDGGSGGVGSDSAAVVQMDTSGDTPSCAADCRALTLRAPNSLIVNGMVITGAGIVGTVTVVSISGTFVTISSGQTVAAGTMLTFSPPPGAAGTVGYRSWIDQAGQSISIGAVVPQATNGFCCPDTTNCGDAASNYAGSYEATGSYVGARRVSYTAIDQDDASVLARQNSDGSFSLWTPDGEDEAKSPFYRIQPGKLDGPAMFEQIRTEEMFMKYFLRVLGWVLAWVGCQLFVGPLTVAPDIIPFVGELIGDVIGCMLCIVTCTAATSLSLLVFVIFWIMVRPLYAIPLLLVACGLACAGVFLRRQEADKKKGQRQGKGGGDDVEQQAGYPPPAPPPVLPGTFEVETAANPLVFLPPPRPPVATASAIGLPPPPSPQFDPNLGGYGVGVGATIVPTIVTATPLGTPPLGTPIAPPRPRPPPKAVEPSPSVDEDTRQAFAKYDADGSGSISKEEVGAVLADMGIEVHGAYAEGVWKAHDDNGDGFLDVNEFDSFMTALKLQAERQQPPTSTPIPATSSVPDHPVEAWVKESFQKYDVDNSGTISKAEVIQVITDLGIEAEPQYVNGVWDTHDVDVDGWLSLPEYDSLLKVLRTQQAQKDAAEAMSPAQRELAALQKTRSGISIRDRAALRDKGLSAGMSAGEMEAQGITALDIGADGTVSAVKADDL